MQVEYRSEQARVAVDSVNERAAGGGRGRAAWVAGAIDGRQSRPARRPARPPAAPRLSCAVAAAVAPGQCWRRSPVPQTQVVARSARTATDSLDKVS